jgi:hypothetical protein
MSMALDSLYQKRLLQSLHPNVHVIRHGKLLWSHHESAWRRRAVMAAYYDSSCRQCAHSI